MGHRTRAVVALLIAAAAAAAACDSSSSDFTPAPAATPGFSEAEMRAAQVLFDSKFCEAYARCAPNILKRLFGTIEECINKDRSLADIAVGYGIGSTQTPSSVTACANALDFSTCEGFARFVAEQRPTACDSLFKGTLPNNSECKSNNQCVSGVCFLSDGAPKGCGRCTPRVKPGSTCIGQSICELGHQCIAQDPDKVARCIPIGELGASCNSQFAPCRADLVCSDGICITAIANNRCDGACPILPGEQFCKLDTRTCELLPVAKLGQPCQFVAPVAPGITPFTQCEHGSVCGPGAPSPSGHVCIPLVGDGEACTTADVYGSPCRGRTSFCSQNVCTRIERAECSAPPVLP